MILRKPSNKWYQDTHIVATILTTLIDVLPFHGVMRSAHFKNAVHRMEIIMFGDTLLSGAAKSFDEQTEVMTVQR